MSKQLTAKMKGLPMMSGLGSVQQLDSLTRITRLRSLWHWRFMGMLGMEIVLLLPSLPLGWTKAQKAVVIGLN